MIDVLLQIALVLVAVFLILLILVQRGRGGGLAGALGGMGGQSAFGTKAGDVFTRVTGGTAILWFLLCILSIKILNSSAGPVPGDIGGSKTTNSSQTTTGDPLKPGAGVAPGAEAEKKGGTPSAPVTSGAAPIDPGKSNGTSSGDKSGA
jgi:preprotein translocase subunit SecG